MAGPVATCASSSGGAQPSPGPHKVPAFCESAPEPRQRKGRGGAKGYEIAQKVIQDGKITVEFDEAGVGIHTRDICEPFHDAWKDISDMGKRTIQNRMLFIRKLTMRFNDVKLFCKDWFNMDSEKISGTNKTNRSNQKYPSLHGRVSYSQHHNKKVSTETQKPMSTIDNWANMHRHGASWVNTQAEQTFNTLEETRQTQRTQSTSSSTRPTFDEHGVLEQVLACVEDIR
ncbi:hypothetical protein L484_020042 [Morus notabilis]|uniref:Uncharacterized protein n=1 Tax=Morus notabilis TaxID=981085 RepID=W9SZZ5_9ROSA|nr:hypothetical protein L484_020042 [Morus notabilis]